jgi:hypothetical protein
VAIAAARMTGNAVQNGGAVHEVLDVLLQFVQSRVDGHVSRVVPRESGSAQAGAEDDGAVAMTLCGRTAQKASARMFKKRLVR